uniref:Mos1 transposase HTH domain-containing protein n=1 Tax=Acrobeloides nanus TaxID=290746 RepID=A0A914ENY6_9BILA
MLYHFEKGNTAGEAFRDINKLFGEETIGRSTVKEWFVRFKSASNSDVYLAQLDRLHAAIQVKRPRKKNHIVFHHDNAKPHVEGRVIESIEEKGWDLLPHPSYYTEAPTDYHVNRSLKNWMMNKVYEDLD